MQNKRRLAEKVLEYWFTLEFLGQDKYPQKELLDARGAARSLKSKIAKEVSGTLEKKATGTLGWKILPVQAAETGVVPHRNGRVQRRFLILWSLISRRTFMAPCGRKRKPAA